MPFLDAVGLEHVAEIIKSSYASKNSDGAVVSAGADYAEYVDWNDGNTSNENRTGYFVTVVDGTNDIAKANSDSAIVGVTTDSAGFIGNYSAGAETNNAKGLVGIVGQISVIDNGTCIVGERCMPADDGTAEPSSNNCGYKVIERIDETHVRIMVSPTIDMIQRIKTDVSEIENLFAGALPVANGGTDANNIVDANANLGIGGKLLWSGSKNGTGSITVTDVHKYQNLMIRTTDAFYTLGHVRNGIFNIRGAHKNTDNMVDLSVTACYVRALIGIDTFDITASMLHKHGVSNNVGVTISEIWGFGRIVE